MRCLRCGRLYLNENRVALAILRTKSLKIIKARTPPMNIVKTFATAVGAGTSSPYKYKGEPAQTHNGKKPVCGVKSKAVIGIVQPALGYSAGL